MGMTESAMRHDNFSDKKVGTIVRFHAWMTRGTGREQIKPYVAYQSDFGRIFRADQEC
jgi:hypothetical protein